MAATNHGIVVFCMIKPLGLGVKQLKWVPFCVIYRRNPTICYFLAPIDKSPYKNALYFAKGSTSYFIQQYPQWEFIARAPAVQAQLNEVLYGKINANSPVKRTFEFTAVFWVSKKTPERATPLAHPNKISGHHLLVFPRTLAISEHEKHCSIAGCLVEARLIAR